MPVEIVNKLATDGENSVELRLIIQNAAVLKGKRISGMLFLNDKELARISMKLHNTNISLIILCTCKKRHLVMVYRAKELEEHLRSKEVSDYLREFGYRRDDFISNLIRLHQRMNGFYNKMKEFPHEVGVFLGYPICDIKGFLENKGERYLHSGYWKIYGNLEETRKKFLSYDEAREIAIDEFLSGRELESIAC
ncbi:MULTISPECIES: DUF3793 family protein [Lachnoanaerobaculum]|jgi:hypothetical protein|nr:MULTISPECIES: DUF3793 family protein [Lachnoanaerobaculum]MBF1011222.1 DUF3793 family protein [Lachnoanaerobaculum sp.]MBS6729187.1 DUF3793 family protein [Lachnospiraceae bacterium oral taxon 082]MDU5598237.1 DUF3793 family protein [Lachnospiraceae bacterium]MBS6930194.1 DUF3793 family protein [Lachnospiraceae bacterium oral taxon 082]RRJ13509.1 DUF3793 family protein [Lachnoanaerobaculum orale]